MDARKYGSKNIRPDSVREEPIQTRIINVFEADRFGRMALHLELESGAVFGLGDANRNALIAAWGSETDKWIGLEAEFYLGMYKDWNSDPIVEKETVRVRAASPTAAGEPNGGTPIKPALPSAKAAASAGDDMDDSIPF